MILEEMYLYGYIVNDYQMIENKDDIPTMLVKNFTIYEVSIVSAPADPFVRVNRNLKIGLNTMENKENSEEEKVKACEDTSKVEEKACEDVVKVDETKEVVKETPVDETPVEEIKDEVVEEVVQEEMNDEADEIRASG